MKPPGRLLRYLQCRCPHTFGWALIPSGRRRFCRACGSQQRLTNGIWLDVTTKGAP